MDTQGKFFLRELKQAVLCNPCLCWFDHRKLTVLHTNFSAPGFGYVVCQPGDNEVSLSMTEKYILGIGFGFMTKSGGGILHPVDFGCRRTRGNETWLHSFLGKGFAGDWAINRVRHMCFGRWFVWVNDCYAVKFILSYDGFESCNPWSSDMPDVLGCGYCLPREWLFGGRGLLVTSECRSLLRPHLPWVPTACFIILL